MDHAKHDNGLTARLKGIRNLPTCTPWSQGFIDSIVTQIEAGRTISQRQMEVVNRLFDENSPEAQKKLANWEEEYKTKHKANGYIIASYYRAQGGGYYGNVATPVLSGEVPDRRAFLKMVNNKYAKKVLAELARPPRFGSDTHIIPNSKFYTGYSATCAMIQTREGKLPRQEVRENFKNRGGIILGVDDKIVSAAKGSKRYLVLPFGASEVYLVEERFLKTKPKVKKAKK